MPTNPDDVKKLLSHPEFKALAPEEQVSTFSQYLKDNDEEYGTYSPLEQRSLASQVIEESQPGFLRKVADFLPVVGPALRGAESKEGLRPATRMLFEQGEDPAAIESPFRRGAAEGLRDVAEMLGLSLVGGAIARPIVGAMGAGATAAGLELGGSAAAQAGRAALMKRLTERAITDGSMMGLQTLAHNVEAVAMTDRELNVLHDLILDPAAGAAMGAGLGVGFSQIARAFKGFTSSMKKGLGMTDDGLAAFTSKALAEPLDDTEFAAFRQVLKRDPELMRNPTAQQILKVQSPYHMQTKSLEGEGLLRLLVERPGGAVETLIVRSASDADEVLERVKVGDAFVKHAEGKGADAFTLRSNEANLISREVASAKAEQELAESAQAQVQRGLASAEENAQIALRTRQQLREDAALPIEEETIARQQVGATVAQREAARVQSEQLTDAIARNQMQASLRESHIRAQEEIAHVQAVRQMAQEEQLSRAIIQEQLDSTLPIRVDRTVPPEPITKPSNAVDVPSTRTRTPQAEPTSSRVSPVEPAPVRGPTVPPREELPPIETPRPQEGASVRMPSGETGQVTKSDVISTEVTTPSGVKLEQVPKADGTVGPSEVSQRNARTQTQPKPGPKPKPLEEMTPREINRRIDQIDREIGDPYAGGLKLDDPKRVALQEESRMYLDELLKRNNKTTQRSEGPGTFGAHMQEGCP